MPNRSTLPAFLLLLAPAALGAQQPQSADAAGVTATIGALFAAAERGDLDALGAIYAGDDLTVIEGAGIDRT